jgi:hypothetical protein
VLKVRRKSDGGLKSLPDRIEALIDKVGKDALRSIKGFTPIRSGRARRGWTYEGERRPGWTVSNQVPYIERLEAGHSRQAPRGILAPTKSTVRRSLSRHGRLRSGRLTR